MIKYRQLIKRPVKARKNIWYIQGSDTALVTDALNVARSHVISDISSVCLGVFHGDSCKVSDIEEFILRPYFEERKLVIVHNPTKLKDLSDVLQVIDTSTFYILIDYTHEPCTDIVEVLKNNSKGKFISCSNPVREDFELLVTSRLNIEKSAVDKLIMYSNFDSEWLLNKVSILEYLDVEEITVKLVDLICTDQGTQNFEDALIGFDKQSCLRYIKDRGVSDISIYKIANDLHNLSILNSASVEFSKQLRPITDKTGLSRREVEKYASDILYYDTASSKRCFNMLTNLSESLKIKNELAFLALVCGW